MFGTERMKLGARMGLAVVGVLATLAVSAGSASAASLPVQAGCEVVTTSTGAMMVKLAGCPGMDPMPQGVRWQ
jgi:hypothetical protein